MFILTGLYCAERILVYSEDSARWKWTWEREGGSDRGGGKRRSRNGGGGEKKPGVLWNIDGGGGGQGTLSLHFLLAYLRRRRRIDR